MVMLGQYNLVLLGIKWYWVSKVPLCLYVEEKKEIWLGVTNPSQTDAHTTEYKATATAF